MLAAQWRCLPYHYLRYGLYEQPYSLADARAYLPETIFYYKLLPAINEDTLLLDNKLVTKRLLAAADVPQPKLLFTGDGIVCRDVAGRIVRPEDPSVFSGVCSDGEQVVIKPARYSSGGDGVLVLTHKRGTFVADDGSTMSLVDYGRRWGDWLIEGYVHQREDLAALNARSLNTFRVITTIHPTRGARVEYCVLKLGARGGPVDNAHDGGLYVGVDKKTGDLAAVAFDEDFRRHTHHPISGVRFDGYRIDAVADVVALAERCAALFPQTALVGWDIAVGKDGAVVIEGNSSPGLTNVQRTHGGVARTLGAYLREIREGGAT